MAVCLLERATGSIRVLLRVQEALVLMEPDASYLLLCAAEITQPSAWQACTWTTCRYRA